ncbi:unnamed protein product [Durusdinium trenchii]|uniref:Uncharacterized protein n=1 Tax=Durusdinium trenchii TaxID=1381693 RepID=A0ABP0R525_9DINO
MAKKIMKAVKDKPQAWPAPKRGKSRTLMKSRRWQREKGQERPHCGAGKLQSLRSFKDRKVWAHKCAAKHDFSSYHIGYMNHKPVSHIHNNLELARSRHVMKKQKEIQVGASHQWCDVEADEVDVGKEMDLHHKKAKWEQWGGIGRDVILHTDGAKTYRMKLRGVLRDNVALTKKSDGVKGKPVWVKPHFAKMCQHKLPHGKRVTVKLPPAHLPETQGRVHCACPVNFEFCSAHTGIEPKAFGSLLARCFRICTPN